MREIKFRAWDLDNEKMQWPTEITNEVSYGQMMCQATFELHDGAWIETCPPNPGPFNYELMQYTGLKDKNGNEIYEGDIVTYGALHPERLGTVNYEVFYPENKDGRGHALFLLRETSSGECLLQPFSVAGEVFSAYCQKLDEMKTEPGEVKIEIIGNIYEDKHLINNPELLNQTNDERRKH